MRPALLASVAGLVLVAAGCGAEGDDDGGGDGNAFKAGANRICRELGVRSAAVAAPTSPASYVSYGRETADVLDDVRRGMAALELPAGANRGPAQRVVAAFEAFAPQATKLRSMADAVAAAPADPAATGRAKETLRDVGAVLVRVGDGADPSFERLGLKACGG
ncbi:MAG: hypothetical protein H0T43_01795 [Solirubrobacterales bacterium]|nr:hypothetical protein [Solirubrobacterales bacterium]